MYFSYRLTMNEYGVPCLDLSRTTDSPQLFQPLSLWRLVEQHVPGPERWEVKSMLGANLVDESQQLHDEVLLLTDILKEYENQEEEILPLATRIPEPPQVREILIKEISFFVDSIQEKVGSQGNSSKKVLARCNKNVLDYVSQQKTKIVSRDVCGNSRASSSLSLSSDGRLSMNSISSDEIQEMSHSLNILQIDDVVQHLRSTLQTEISQLLRDVETLQNSLSERIDLTSPESYRNPNKSIPTLSELRQERTMLEKELLKETDNDEFFDPLPPSSRKPISSLELFPDIKAQTDRWRQSVQIQQKSKSIPMLLQNTDVLKKDQTNQLESCIPNMNNSSNMKSLVGGQFVPRPPTVGQPRQLASDKFRRMVYHCRNSEAH
ncbi:unnamed protein product [Acanthosepion pharaonis]|uniref:Coiled-coil domain-containing protein 24 n=1 Tax=Acanthosepion pharaonis TaxID=158019 RepID=A0A812E493_ACAPH|nr:unnamed protein product [Sepia pharaonis]